MLWSARCDLKDNCGILQQLLETAHAMEKRRRGELDDAKALQGRESVFIRRGGDAKAKKIFEAGGSIKKGEKGQFVIFWRWIEAEDEETGELKKIPLLRYYKVFNILTQCEGLTSKRNDEIYEHNPIEEAEAVVFGYEDKPTLTMATGRAFYRPSQDRISVPPLADYKVPEEYHCTARSSTSWCIAQGTPSA